MSSIVHENADIPLMIRQRDVLQTKHCQRERERERIDPTYDPNVLPYKLTMRTKPHQSIGDCAQHNKTFE
jgi:hypothetical protein